MRCELVEKNHIDGDAGSMDVDGGVATVKGAEGSTERHVTHSHLALRWPEER